MCVSVRCICSSCTYCTGCSRRVHFILCMAHTLHIFQPFAFGGARGVLADARLATNIRCTYSAAHGFGGCRRRQQSFHLVFVLFFAIRTYVSVCTVYHVIICIVFPFFFHSFPIPIFIFLEFILSATMQPWPWMQLSSSSSSRTFWLSQFGAPFFVDVCCSFTISWK